MLKAGSERGFSALSQNVFAYVWERSLNLPMNAVKKTFLSNSLDITLTQALIVISISVSYNEYITLLQQVSYNLKSIQKAVTQECCTMITIITQQFYTDFMNWEPTEHVSVTAAKTEKKHKAQWVSKKKVTECHIKWLCMWCEESRHFIKECKLLSTVQSQIINVTAAEIMKKVIKTNENLKKE